AEEGYTVLRAADGISAVSMLTPEPLAPDVIMCDVMLPRMSGDRVAREIRRLFPARRLPIILMSASDDPRVGLRDGRFVSKPIEFADLLALVELVTRPSSQSTRVSIL